MNERRPTRWLARAALATLVVYWAALVAGTHWPRPPHLLGLGASDKLLHFSAYCGLAVLVCLNCWLRGEFGWRQAAAVIAGLALFGALDELTQPPVGRHASAWDWLADVGGTATGTLTFIAAVRAWEALRGARTAA